jgi:hypothetical protein
LVEDLTLAEHAERAVADGLEELEEAHVARAVDAGGTKAGAGQALATCSLKSRSLSTLLS